MKKLRLLLWIGLSLFSFSITVATGPKANIFEKGGFYGFAYCNDTILSPEYNKIEKFHIVYAYDTVGVYIKTYKDGKYGLKFKLKNDMPCEYDSIMSIKYMFNKNPQGNGWYAIYFTAVVEKNGVYGIFDVDKGKLTVPCKFSEISDSYGTFRTKLNNGSWGLYSYSGELLVPVGGADALRAGPYNDNLYIVEKNGKYGAYHNGKLIIPVIHGLYGGVNQNYMPTKIFFEQKNKDNTGTTYFIYSITGRLIAKRFFYNDQRKLLNVWWRRYAQ